MADEAIKGTLKKTKKGAFVVTVPTKKGTADMPISLEAKCFRDEDAEDGLEVDVVRAAGKVVKVTIPGKQEVQGKKFVPQAESRGRDRGPRHSGGRTHHGAQRGTGGSGSSHGPTDVRGLPKVAGSFMGLPFHNPYTFLPFPKEGPPRQDPTPHSIAEDDGEERYSGVLQLSVTTRSPLLSCEALSHEDKRALREGRKADRNAPKVYDAMTIGNDVVLPATGVRGALRYLMTILSGGPLTHLDDGLYLCQGRDARLGPSKDNLDIPGKAFLGRVVATGSALRPGTLELGQTELIPLVDLHEKYAEWKKLRPRHDIGEIRQKVEQWRECKRNRDKSGARRLQREITKAMRDNERELFTQREGRRSASLRDIGAPRLWAQLHDGQLLKLSDRPSSDTRWQIRLSGGPINLFGKREGAFLPGGLERQVRVAAPLWEAYTGRHAHGDRPELRKDDLVWLEPTSPDATEIAEAGAIKSLQWARWGKHGDAAKDCIAPEYHPDWTRSDGQVSTVTDLFGQVPPNGNREAPSFAGRIRPDNLVFPDGRGKVGKHIPLAVRGQPHPGCMAFYRNNTNPDRVGPKDKLRGYKVYRTTEETGPDAPWHYHQQGVYDDKGALKPVDKVKVSMSAQLLPAGTEGSLTIAYRGLSNGELALLLQACRVPWRLGGGKPLGLGWCQPQVVRHTDEWGNNQEDPTGLPEALADRLVQMASLWEASQQPVPLLRYPRAAVLNRNKVTRGGLTWFQEFAAPRKGSQDEEDRSGLEPTYLCGDAAQGAEATMAATGTSLPAGPVQVMAGQVLPPFDPEDPLADVLYGYDVFLDEKSRQWMEFNRNRQECYSDLPQFDPDKHVPASARSSGTSGQNRDTRERNKQDRRHRGEGS